MVSTLTDINPSLAWLPIFAEMGLLKNDAALPLWVEQNFPSVQAVCDVVSNIRFFNQESANILESRLSRRDSLEPLLTKSWQLIIRHIRNTRRRSLQDRWFTDLMPRLSRGDLSTVALEDVAQALVPKPFVEAKHELHKEPERERERPTDLMSVKYRVDVGVSERDFFAAWPHDAPPAKAEQLIRILTNSLEPVLADAIDLGIESNTGLSISDIDVPSVAAHEQNSYRAGFLLIIRVAAELWSRLIQKHVHKARSILLTWKTSNYRLMHRLALYAAENPKIGPALAASLLTSIPRGELFLTNSRVEVHRLIRNRWKDFSPTQRRLIEKRIVEGPPINWFRAGADLSDVVDRGRFELLLEIERSKIPPGREASAVLADIRQKHPNWRGAEPEKVGFVIWQGRVTSIAGSSEKFKSVSDDKLIAVAQNVANQAEFLDGDAWETLCQDDPIRAFRGIEKAPAKDRWHEWSWRPFLWAATKITNPNDLNRIAFLLARWPSSMPFDETASAAAWWMDQISDKLSARRLWSVWNVIEQRAPRGAEVLNNDPFVTAANSVPGQLASVLLKRTPSSKRKPELGHQLRARYEKLVKSNDSFALLARVRISEAIAFLFERAPLWTRIYMLPSFNWTSTDAPAMWSARKYSNIGSHELFSLTKQPFLALFSRPDTPDDDLNAFSEWLVVILIANQSGTSNYDLTPNEVRSVLRHAGPSTLSSFASHLAMTLRSARAEDRAWVWKKSVGPVFEGAWPLDVELQTAEATRQLVEMLLATGSAFGEAATTILPFIRPEDPRQYMSVYSISEANAELYGVAPEKMLDLLSAVAGGAADRTIYGLDKALDKLKEKAPQLVKEKKFQKLAAQAWVT